MPTPRYRHRPSHLLIVAAQHQISHRARDGAHPTPSSSRPRYHRRTRAHQKRVENKLKGSEKASRAWVSMSLLHAAPKLKQKVTSRGTDPPYRSLRLRNMIVSPEDDMLEHCLP